MTRINPVSKKRQALNIIRRSFVKKILNDRLMCEARIQGCSYMPTDVHEIKTRARGGNFHSDENNVLALCRNCHHFITVEPAWSQENGFTVHAWADESDIAAAKRARHSFVFGLVGDFFEEIDEGPEFDDD